jgi:hypothetical protein
MKAKETLGWLAALLAPALLYAGETPLLALHPLYTPGAAVLNPALVDMWGDLFSFRIEPDGDGGYHVTDISDGQNYAQFHLVRIGGESVADVVFGDPPFMAFQLPVHCFARVRVDGDTLHVDWLGSAELAQQVARTGSPRHERLRGDGQDEDSMVLTASSAELQQFVLDCLKRPDAFGESDDFERAGPKDRAAELNRLSLLVVSGPASREAFITALGQAEEAVRLVPTEPDYWSTLGAAQYRVGAFHEARAALTRAVEIRKSTSLVDAIYRAMSDWQLGQTADAMALLLDLSKTLRDPRYPGDFEQYCGERDTRSLLREAQDLMAQKEK